MKSARQTLRLEVDFVARTLDLPLIDLLRIERGETEISASLWFEFCQRIHLESDALLLGYDRELHLLQAHSAILKGNFNPPNRNEILKLAKAGERRHRKRMRARLAQFIPKLA